MSIRAFLSVALAAFALGASCEVTSPDLSGEVGTVRFVDLEGGCWVIETAEETYEPMNLPDELRIDGLDVTFEGEVRDDVATTCMVGPVLQLVRISPAEG